MIHHPKLRNDFTDQLSVTKNAYDGTFRNHNSNGFSNCTHVRGGNMTATESQRDLHFRCDSIEIATRGKNNSCLTYHEPTIELSQFLDGSPKIRIGDISRRLRV